MASQQQKVAELKLDNLMSDFKSMTQEQITQYSKKLTPESLGVLLFMFSRQYSKIRKD